MKLINVLLGMQVPWLMKTSRTTCYTWKRKKKGQCKIRCIEKKARARAKKNTWEGNTYRKWSEDKEKKKRKKREKKKRKKKEREEKEEGERKEKEEREKEKKEETRKRKEEEKREKDKERRDHYELLMKKVLTFLLLFYYLGKNYLSKSNNINNGKKKGYLGKTCSSSKFGKKKWW